MTIAGITFTVEIHAGYGDLVATDQDGNEIGRTTLAEGAVRSEQLWHFVREAIREIDG